MRSAWRKERLKIKKVEAEVVSSGALTLLTCMDKLVDNPCSCQFCNEGHILALGQCSEQVHHWGHNLAGLAHVNLLAFHL